MGCHRKIRTTQELRSLASASDMGVKVRAKRGKKRLPDAWEDIAVYSQRSWKKHRKTRWK